jgi:predicted 3-demethylubiquinone-9 3-methyltransferase (glyoxalase superfamily)
MEKQGQGRRGRSCPQPSNSKGKTFFAINGGPQFSFTPAISFFVNCEKPSKKWMSCGRGFLRDGKKERCGWVKDKYGLSWQIIPTALGEMLGDKDPEKAKRVMQAMLQMDKIDLKALKQKRMSNDNPAQGRCFAAALCSGDGSGVDPSLPSRGRARSSRVLCASGVRVHPTTDAAHASNAPAHCAIHDAHDLLAGCYVRVSRLPGGVRARRERLGADIGLGLLPEGAALRRKAETQRE